MLVVGLVCNLLVRPVAARWFMDQTEVSPAPAQEVDHEGGVDSGRLTAITILAWAGVGIPIAWGVWITLSKASALFG
jgi:hypothetical protein